MTKTLLSLSKRTLKERFLQSIYELKPFNIQGDMPLPLPHAVKDYISCVICSRRSAPVLQKLLQDLTQQTLAPDQFEVIIYDNTPSGKEPFVEKFSSLLTLKYLSDDTDTGLLGHFRNLALTHARGDHILFLDDDTRLPQSDFLSTALALFKQTNADIIMPQGHGLPLENHSHYHYLDAYSFATRCSFYNRSLLEQLGGFRGNVTGYEDIDLGIRAIITKAAILKTDQITYEHPPLFFHSLNKPVAIGQSIQTLRQAYPFHLWLILWLNALSLLPLFLWPTTQNRNWAKISLGVLIAPFRQKKETYHS